MKSFLSVVLVLMICGGLIFSIYLTCQHCYLPETKPGYLTFNVYNGLLITIPRGGKWVRNTNDYFQEPIYTEKIKRNLSIDEGLSITNAAEQGGWNKFITARAQFEK